MTELIIAFSSVITLILGGGGILFYKQSKRLKRAEAEAAEKAVITKDLENQKSTNDEWIRLYKETKEELITTRAKNAELQNKLQKAVEVEGHQRLVINDLEWSRCVVNGCLNRQPPRDFHKKLEKIENMHEDITRLSEYDSEDEDYTISPEPQEVD